MSLGTLGIISAVKIVIYAPIVFFAFGICSKYGVRERGWLLLFIFSLIRIIAGALSVVTVEQGVEQTGRPVSGPFSKYYHYFTGHTLDASSLSLLLLSTLGLIEIITERPSRERKNWHTFVLRMLHIVGIVALVLTIVGMSNPREDKNSGGVIMVQIGALLLAGLFIVLVAVTVLQWASRYRPMKYREQLLVAVSVALPFLAVRTLYSVLSSFSYTYYIGFDPKSPLAKFSIYNLPAEWEFYVFMEVVMEYAVVVIYVLAGTLLRLDEDLQESDPRLPRSGEGSPLCSENVM